MHKELQELRELKAELRRLIDKQRSDLANLLEERKETIKKQEAKIGKGQVKSQIASLYDISSLEEQECNQFYLRYQSWYTTCLQQRDWVALNFHFNQLIYAWDEYLTRRRHQKRQGLMPKHKFFISDATNASEMVTVDKYAPQLPPDTRIVHIGIHKPIKPRKIFRASKQTRTNLLRIMHEAGHLVGFRNRQSRFEKYFLPRVNM